MRCIRVIHRTIWPEWQSPPFNDARRQYLLAPLWPSWFKVEIVVKVLGTGECLIVLYFPFKSILLGDGNGGGMVRTLFQANYNSEDLSSFFLINKKSFLHVGSGAATARYEWVMTVFLYDVDVFSFSFFFESNHHRW